MTDVETPEFSGELNDQSKFTPHEQLVRLWQIPEEVPEGFRIPEDVHLTLASGSDFKRRSVTDVWNSLGGKGIIITQSKDEEQIKKELSNAHRARAGLMGDEGVVDTFRTLSIAEQKARMTDDELLKKHGATHVMGLDIDVIPWPNEEPLGTPQNTDDLVRNLRQMSGKSVMVSIGCALRRVGGLTGASEQVHITLPIKEFDADEYVRDHENGAGIIGRVAGGIDFSDPASFPYLGSGPVIIDRMWRHSPDFSPLTQLERTIVVNGDRREELLGEMGDYFKGAPQEMVKWVLYDGIGKNPATV